MITLLIIPLIFLVIAIIMVLRDCESGIIPFVLVVIGIVLFSFYVALNPTTEQTYTVPANVIGYGIMEDKTLFDADGETIVVDGMYESENYMIDFDSNGTRDKNDDFVVNVYRRINDA